MSWSTCGDVRGFLAEAGEFLRARPVEHTMLLTEAAYLAARPAGDEQADEQVFGWWCDARGEVAGAFLRAPRHAPVLSLMPQEAIDSLGGVLGGSEALEADGRLAQSVAAAWKQRLGRELFEERRITLFRLEGSIIWPDLPRGGARVATLSDRAMLLRWYQMMMKQSPEDPSESKYVIDDPLGFGGITLWAVDGEPVAMAGRSRLVASMVRMSAVYAADGKESHADAAFATACHAASEMAEHVLVFARTGDGDTARKYAALGFRPVLQRVMLGSS